MKIAVRSTAIQYGEFIARGIPPGTEVIIANDPQVIPEAAAYFDLLFEENGPAFTSVNQQLVFVNAVITTNRELPDNYIRINGWNSFFSREVLEIADSGNPYFLAATDILKALNWPYQPVADIPGMIAARVIAMIINEAYFSLGEGISTKEEIDIAMKTGTNYPYGPFEWGEKIGLQKIYALLKKLGGQDARYEIAPELERVVTIHN